MKHCTDYFTLSLCWLVSFLVLLCINFLLLQQTEQRTHLYLSACQIFNGSCNMIGSWHDTVICLNTVALWHSRSVEGTESCTVLFLGIWSALGTSDSNSRHTAPPINVFDIDIWHWHSRTLPIHFFRHFCCRMYHVATIAVPQHTARNWNAEISASGIAIGTMVMWPWLVQIWNFQ